MKKLLTLTSAVLVLSSSFTMAADQLNGQASDSTTTMKTAYQYDSSDDNGRNSDQ